MIGSLRGAWRHCAGGQAGEGPKVGEAAMGRCGQGGRKKNLKIIKAFTEV